MRSETETAAPPSIAAADGVTVTVAESANGYCPPTATVVPSLSGVICGL